MVASTMLHSSRHSWNRRPTHLAMHHPMKIHQSRNLPPCNQRQPCPSSCTILVKLGYLYLSFTSSYTKFLLLYAITQQYMGSV
jgi:hypothetical protein